MSDFSTKKTPKRSIETNIKLKEPDLYKVVMLNDNFTTMEFVVEILIDIFGKSARFNNQDTGNYGNIFCSVIPVLVCMGKLVTPLCSAARIIISSR